MGLRGPAPKPTALRKMEGNPSRRPLPANEPYYAPGVPTKPKGISKAASPIWDQLVEEMAASAVLRRVDQRALWQLAEDEALLASAYQGIWNMADEVKRERKIAAQKTGTEAAEATTAAPKKRAPKGGEILQLLAEKDSRMAINAVGHLAARVVIQRREFGLTPASRTRIEVELESVGSTVDALEMKLCG